MRTHECTYVHAYIYITDIKTEIYVNGKSMYAKRYWTIAKINAMCEIDI